jgi:methionyl-tRNA formyltransferase
LLNGDSETGVTLMKMDQGMDTGAIIAIARTPIADNDDAESVHDRLGRMAAKLLIEKLPLYIAGSLQPTPQPEGATMAPKIKKEDGKLDWAKPARVLWNQVRGLTPWPGTFTHIPAEPKPLLLKVWKADLAETSATLQPGEIMRADGNGIVVATGEGALRLTEVQREGGKRLPIRDFLRGHPLQPGQRFL